MPTENNSSRFNISGSIYGAVNTGYIAGNVSGFREEGNKAQGLAIMSLQVTNAVNQLVEQSEAEKLSLKESLTQLQHLIETDDELSIEDKFEALEQVRTLAEIGPKPNNSTLRKAAKTAIKILKGTISSLSNAKAHFNLGMDLLSTISTLIKVAE